MKFPLNTPEFMKTKKFKATVGTIAVSATVAIAANYFGIDVSPEKVAHIVDIIFSLF